MKERQSETDANLFLLEDAEAFSHHAEQLIEQSDRDLAILSQALDPLIYDQENLADRISQLARSNPRARIRILVKDTRPLVERGHKLLTLARRLSSKVEIRKLLTEPENDSHAYLIGDRNLLLYKHDDRDYQGFANYQAGPEAQKFLEEFNFLWDRHSEVPVDLRTLRI